MTMKQLDAKAFKQMVAKGADHLAGQAKTIDALNVFPVPDGDTGTNMNLTMTSGLKEMERDPSDKVGQAAEALSKGLLMGARGNSGVILSQLFRGFSRSLSGKTDIRVKDFTAALEAGMDAAYKAVIKPVEGTVLTVAKDAAKRGVQVSRKSDDFITVMEEIVRAARDSLKRTPELLPVLKEVGVVDSGGQGLVTIYEGFLSGLSGKSLPGSNADDTKMEEMINAVHHKKAQTHMKTKEIEYGYCTEFMVQLKDPGSFDEAVFRDQLGKHGDSLLVVTDQQVAKVHIHTERPGDMLTLGQHHGELLHVKIDNMRRQHREILDEREHEQEKQPETLQPYGFVTVAAGDGLTDLLKGLGAGIVIEGGQTMNPSTEDFVSAVREAGAEHVFILPNNGNVVMAAQQAAEVADHDVKVIPTKTIPQGIAALVAFNPEANVETNEKNMAASAEHVKSGEVTFAVRDTTKDGIDIKKDDFIAIADGKMIAADSNETEAAKKLLANIVDEDDALVTLLYGEEGSEEQAKKLAAFVEDRCPDVEVEIHHGGQPVYSYIVSVE
ncbi:MAG TPA: DAK2 domain-containing protein [Bacillales bacterium]|nr:DAK2 domain-containing protein [Bacillales bacterium]